MWDKGSILYRIVQCGLAHYICCTDVPSWLMAGSRQKTHRKLKRKVADRRKSRRNTERQR